MSLKPKYRIKKKKKKPKTIHEAPKKPINNSKSKLGKKENHEKKTFESWFKAAPICFQAPRTALVTSVVVSFGVWCGGGLGKQRWKREEAEV